MVNLPGRGRHADRTVEQVVTAEGEPVLEVVEPRGLRVRRFVARLGGLLIVLLMVLMLWTLIQEVRAGRDDAQAARDEAVAAREEAANVRRQLTAAEGDRQTLLGTVERQATQLDALTQQLLASGVDPADLGVPEVPTNGGSGPTSGGSGGTPSGGGSAPSSAPPGPAGPAGPTGPAGPPASPTPAPLPEPCLLRSPIGDACLIPLP